MSVRLRSVAIALAAVALVAVPMSAETFTITLKNGSTFASRYQPEDASWDPDKMVFLDEWSNLISLRKDEVESIMTDTESRGFGKVINSTTIALGWAPNDALDPNSEEGKAALAAERREEFVESLTPPVYNQEQFVEPSQASGIPLSFIGAGETIPPMGEPIPAPASAPPPQQ
ncbi:MAG: hypothetical protein KDB94_12255 [Acidobacteria bacterium]|nr:hypothetical protein [Acidobacteriota bacterium]MCB9377876.1 hypothetical protein [Holophagales bacterium]